MHWKLECLPDINEKNTLSVLFMEIFISGSGKQFIGKNHPVLNETAPLPDRTGKQSLLL
jgi:hypothetical protein